MNLFSFLCLAGVFVSSIFLAYDFGKRKTNDPNLEAMHKSYEVALNLELLEKSSKIENKSDMEKTMLAATVNEVKWKAFKKEFDKYAKRKTNPKAD